MTVQPLGSLGIILSSGVVVVALLTRTQSARRLMSALRQSFAPASPRPSASRRTPSVPPAPRAPSSPAASGPRYVQTASPKRNPALDVPDRPARAGPSIGETARTAAGFSIEGRSRKFGSIERYRGVATRARSTPPGRYRRRPAFAGAAGGGGRVSSSACCPVSHRFFPAIRAKPKNETLSPLTQLAKPGMGFHSSAFASASLQPPRRRARELDGPGREDEGCARPSALELSDRNACDVELLATGGFSPLRGFMDEDTYTHCVKEMRLPGSNLLFGMPIVLDTDCEDTKVGDKVLLRYQGKDVAVVTVESKWKPDKPLEAKMCYGTSSIEHPGVSMISMERRKYYIGGKVEGLAIPERPFPCPDPAAVRAMLPEGKDVVAFQCRNPIHRAHYELFTRALDAENVGEGAVALVHPTMGPTQDDDISGLVRYHTYEVLAKEVNNPMIRWAYSTPCTWPVPARLSST